MSPLLDNKGRISKTFKLLKVYSGAVIVHGCHITVSKKNVINSYIIYSKLFVGKWNDYITKSSVHMFQSDCYSEIRFGLL